MQTESVAEWMSWSPLHVGVETPVVEAESFASKAGVHHLLVFDGDTLAGLLCNCDLRDARLNAPVSTCMTETPVTVDATASATNAARIMRERAIGCLPVVSGGLVLGIVTRSDLMRAGFKPEDLGGSRCPSCGAWCFDQPQARGDCRFCLDCKGQSGSPAAEDDLGTVD